VKCGSSYSGSMSVVAGLSQITPTVNNHQADHPARPLRHRS
jgi:hypothetical protein